MGNTSDFGGEYKYYSVYNGQTLWRLIPQSMRYWWINAVKSIFFENRYPFENVTINNPLSIFVDKTIETNEFQDDFNSQ